MLVPNPRSCVILLYTFLVRPSPRARQPLRWPIVADLRSLRAISVHIRHLSVRNGGIARYSLIKLHRERQMNELFIVCCCF